MGKKFVELLYSVLIILPSFTQIVWFYIWIGPCEVLRVGRSKTGYKKLKKTFTIWDRLTKRNYIKLSKDAVGYQWFFVIMTYIGYFLLFVLLIIWLVSLFTHNFFEMLRYYIIIKAYSIELSALIFVFLNLCRPKDKIGFEWRFQRDYRNKKNK